MDDVPFWEQELRGFEPTAFPDLTGHSPEARKQLTGSSLSEAALDIPVAVLEKGCEDLGIGLVHLLQAAWVKVLVAYTGGSDLCIGCLDDSTDEGSGARSDPCSNVLPLRITVEATTNHVDLLKNVYDHDQAIRNRAPPSLDQVHAVLEDYVDTLYDTIISLRNQDDVAEPLLHEHLKHVIDLQIVRRSSEDTLLAKLQCKRSV